jgi:hypothetical protein
MLEFLRRTAKRTERKSRLFTVAVCRRVWHLLPDERSRKAVEVANRYADGEATTTELTAAHEAAYDVAAARAERRIAKRDAPQRAAWAVSAASDPANLAEGVAWEAAGSVGRVREHDAQSDLLRCIFGNPVRPVSLDLSWLTWHDGLIVSMARQMYDSRDFADMPVLADALEEAGCTNQDILGHCREPGPHARGCWVVDAILGKT